MAVPEPHPEPQIIGLEAAHHSYAEPEAAAAFEARAITDKKGEIIAIHDDTETQAFKRLKKQRDLLRKSKAIQREKLLAASSLHLNEIHAASSVAPHLPLAAVTPHPIAVASHHAPVALASHHPQPVKVASALPVAVQKKSPAIQLVGHSKAGVDPETGDKIIRLVLRIARSEMRRAAIRHFKHEIDENLMRAMVIHSLIPRPSHLG